MLGMKENIEGNELEYYKVNFEMYHCLVRETLLMY